MPGNHDLANNKLFSIKFFCEIIKFSCNVGHECVFHDVSRMFVPHILLPFIQHTFVTNLTKGECGEVPSPDPLHLSVRLFEAREASPPSEPSKGGTNPLLGRPKAWVGEQAPLRGLCRL